MALAVAKSDTAHYLHATLERFDTSAIQDISRQFYAAAAPVAVEHEFVQLSYDEGDHVFILKHHNCFGGQLDEALCRIIRNYVAGESDAVTRFAECTLGDPLDDDEIDSEQSDAQREDDHPLTTHVVNFDGVNKYGKARAFHLRDLPPALRNRALTRQNVENLPTLISLRRVRLDPRNEEQVFGGSIGTTLPNMSSAEQGDAQYLLSEILPFSPFTRKITIFGPRDHEPEPGRQRFAGKEPAIGQWLEGMGETRQIDPEVQPEMGGEQFKFARSRTLQNDSLARVRKPKGVPLADHQLPEGQPPEQKYAKPSAGFDALMRSDAIGDTSSETDSSESDEADPFVGMRSVKVVELAKSDDVSSSGGAFTPSSTSRDQQQSVLTIATRTANALSSGSHQTKSKGLAASHGALRSEGGFPSDGRSYAKADRWGLTGDAANHVAWEKENTASLLTQRARRAPLTYDDLASTRAASVSGKDPGMDRALTAAVTPMSYNETPLGGNEPWAKNIVRPDIFVPMGNLVNTDVATADPSRSKAPQYPPGLSNTYASVANTSQPTPPHYPPGLFPPLGSSEQQRPKITNATNAARAPHGIIARPQRPTASQTLELEMSTKSPRLGDTDLMSFNDAEHSTKTTTQDDENLMSFNDDDDAPFIERGKAQDEDPPRLHGTMRQQAGKKQNKKKHSKASTSRSTPYRPAVLELPSPPPPPKVRPSTVVKSDVKAQGPIEPVRSLHLERTVSDLLLSSSLDHETAEVEIKFGLALMMDAEDLIADNGVREEGLQEKLDELPPHHRDTVLQPVLGRQLEDGVYLLRLPTTLSGNVSPYTGEARLTETWEAEVDEPHGMSDRRLYEINILIPGGGQEWLLVFEHDTPEEVKISPLKDSQQQQPSIYVHYPERVWDARIRARPAVFKHPELDKDLEHNIRTFLKTFDSTRGTGSGGIEAPEGLPNFEAVVPDNAFVITKVLAKRELTRALLTREPEDTTSSPPNWIVSEVWDFHVQPSSLTRAGGSSLAIFAKKEKTMRSQGRLWWEASLVYNEAPQEDDGGLETLLNEIVAKLDSVGMPPVVVPKVKPDTEKQAKQEYIPFW